MGLFDKIKDTAKNAVKKASDKISSVVKEESKTETDNYAEDIHIQILPTLGIVTNYSGMDTMFYDICFDDEKERLIVRTENENIRFKYKFLFGHYYNLFNKFKYIKSENRELKKGETAVLHYFSLIISEEYYINFLVCCNFPEDKTEDSLALENYEKTKLFKLIYLFIDIISDAETKLWVNETCEFYQLLPIFDENGEVHIDNAATNAANNRGFM